MSVFAGPEVSSWKEFYGNVEEELPAKMPKLRGKAVNIYAFVDANHAGNVVTRSLHLGIIIYINNVPITWYAQQETEHHQIINIWKQTGCAENLQGPNRCTTLQAANVWCAN